MKRRSSVQRSPSPKRLSHVGRNGSVKMVDVGSKPTTTRTAIAEATVRMNPAAARLIKKGMAKKGDVFVTAQIAGILAAKRTSLIIPLCHPLSLTNIDITCALAGNDRVRIRCAVTCSGKTGVEMEALTGAAVAALTIYDMCKAVDRAMSIERVELVEKAGGKSGRFRRREHA